MSEMYAKTVTWKKTCFRLAHRRDITNNILSPECIVLEHRPIVKYCILSLTPRQVPTIYPFTMQWVLLTTGWYPRMRSRMKKGIQYARGMRSLKARFAINRLWTWLILKDWLLSIEFIRSKLPNTPTTTSTDATVMNAMRAEECSSDPINGCSVGRSVISGQWGSIPPGRSCPLVPFFIDEFKAEEV